MPYGLSFQPGADQNDSQPQGPPNPVQEAVRLLSLRLPSVVGARAISPQALLQAPGQAGLGAGLSGGNALLEWLKRLLQSSGTGMPPQAMGAFGGPDTTSDWLTQETNLGPRPPRPTTTPRIIPQETGEAGGGKEQDAIPSPFVAPLPKIGGEVQTPPESPFQQYGGFPVEESDYYRG